MDLPVELGPQSLAQATSHRGALGDSLRDQVAAIDLEPDPSPLGDVPVEPLGAQRPGERKLDPASPPRALDGLGGARRARRRRADAPRQLRGPAPPRAPRPRERRPGATAPQPSARRPQPPAPELRAEARAAPIRRAARTPGAPRAPRRAFGARPPPGRARRWRGRRAGSAPRLRAPARTRSAPRTARLAGRASGRPRTSPGAALAARPVAGPRGLHGDRSAPDRRPAARPSR